MSWWNAGPSSLSPSLFAGPSSDAGPPTDSRGLSESIAFFFLMERITTLILKTIEDENPYRLLDPDGQMSDGVT